MTTIDLQRDNGETGWRMSWDDKTVTLYDPRGIRVTRSSTDQAHKMVDLRALLGGRISMFTPSAYLSFTTTRTNLMRLQDLAREAYIADSGPRDLARSRYAFQKWAGLAASIVALAMIAAGIYAEMIADNSWSRLLWIVGTMVLFYSVGQLIPGVFGPRSIDAEEQLLTRDRFAS